jgi:hypothetical protein
MTVRFNDVDEFTDELRAECAAGGGGIYRSILRSTFEFVRTGPVGRRVSFIVTFRGQVGNADGGYDPGEIVRLERFIGELWSVDPKEVPHEPDASTRKRMTECREQMDALCKELGIEQRAGVWE